MKNLYLTLLALFCSITSFSQVVTYDISAANLIGMQLNGGDACFDPNEREQSNIGGVWGFTWNSTNANTPSSVSVEVLYSINDATGPHPTTFNGNADNPVTPFFASCNFTINTYNFNPAFYNPLGTNTILINYAASSQDNQIIPNFACSGCFVRVTVDYTMPCTPPSVPTVTLNPMTVCEGDSSLMTIAGNLNNATRWVIYTDSCGGTLVDSTSSTFIMLSIPAGSTTFYVRGEGSCVTPGACGQTTGIGVPYDDPTFSYPDTIFCDNQGAVTPTTVSSGTFSSSPAGLSLNASTGELNPSASATNTYMIYFTTSGTCPASDSLQVTIQSSSDATILPAGPFCDNDTAVTLSAVDPGGVWAGPGITDTINGVFDPAVAGPGAHTISYTIPGQCGDVGFTIVQVIGAPNVLLAPFNPDTVCSTASAFNMPPGTPAGGTYSGPGVSGNMFNPGTAGLGTHTITYTVTQGACTDSASTTVTVETCTGLNGNELSNGLKIFPNPSNGNFEIVFTKDFNGAYLALVDLLGKELYSSVVNSSRIQIDLTGVEKGIYMVKIQYEQQSIMKKIVLQ